MAKKEQDIDQLMGFATEVIRRAGERALAFYGKGNPEMKFDEAVVTEAELQLRESFQAELYARYPEHKVYGETQGNHGYSHEGSRYLWIYDALDGVANFQAGIPIWGMSLALLENFWPLLGLFYMPVTGDLFHARAGQRAFRGDEEIRVSMQETISDESLLLTYSRFHHRFHTTFPGKIRDLGCTTAHVCYVAMGRAEAALLANESFQDLAGVSIVLEAAGGGFYRLDGREFFLNDYLEGQKIDEPLLVGSQDKLSEVLECLQGGR